jgi:Aldose 1-epimerase
MANRVAGGKFSLEGKEYTVAQNNGPNRYRHAYPPVATECILVTLLHVAQLRASHGSLAQRVHASSKGSL